MAGLARSSEHFDHLLHFSAQEFIYPVHQWSEPFISLSKRDLDTEFGKMQGHHSAKFVKWEQGLGEVRELC